MRTIPALQQNCPRQMVGCMLGLLRRGAPINLSYSPCRLPCCSQLAIRACQDDGRDAYSTLVAYFNSLKVLGGALVAMQDDVPKTISAIAPHRSEDARRLGEPEELTSRKASSEIPKILEQLEIGIGEPGFIDILLASNMLSVGVDIPRLGLMVVNGQPKSMSEYIQATSRVGRSRKGPGLVITLYNNTKIRDRAHYETFRTWHSALYRAVEPTSVTPFAPRARDKALHAPLVAMAIHLLGVGPVLSEKAGKEHRRTDNTHHIGKGQKSGRKRS